MADIKKMYRTIMDDHLPDTIIINLDGQSLIYKKRTWKIPDEKTGEMIEKGLRYGENPGQEAALYELIFGNLKLGDCAFITPGNGLVSSITDEDMIQAGKHPGKTNLTDIDNGLNIIKFLMDKPVAAILKHNNPCGVAHGATLSDAYDKANMADRIAAFGGCLIVNGAMDKQTAELVSRNYLEVVCAPDFEEGTIAILAKRKNLRIVGVPGIYKLEKYRDLRFLDFKSLIDGGLIIQQSPVNKICFVSDFLPAKTTYKEKEYAIERQPTDRELEDMLFGWNVEQGITSNSVIFVKDRVTVGIGTGEQDRVGVAEIAIFKAKIKYADAFCFRNYGKPYKTIEQEVFQSKAHRAVLNQANMAAEDASGGVRGAVMISDAFFPFRDGAEVGIKAGVTAIVHPGGSERDWESIQACNKANPKVTMVLTGQRAFRH
jgi:phosphoribosylaminoimidazolecarboxamide formyltransferase / IMP cyclohydrolase